VQGGDYGVAIHPSGSVGFAASTSAVEVIDLSTFSVVDSLDLGDAITDPRPYLGLSGRVSISVDGALLAVTTDNGFSLVQTTPPATPTPTPIPTATPTPSTLTPTPPPAVGGVVGLLEADDGTGPLASDGTADNTRYIARLVAGAVLIGAAGWYARRRWAR
jgi:hypothetical protein